VAETRDETFEISTTSIKTLEISAFDRQLVGKHDMIGSASIKLDPKAFIESPRDILVPLNPRGVVHLRIALEGGEKNDVHYHLNTAHRRLERAKGDMMREIVERMGEFVRVQLSSASLVALSRGKDKKSKKPVVPSEQEMETSLGPLFEYLNENVSGHSAYQAVY
jgi:hypothetical protein